MIAKTIFNNIEEIVDNIYELAQKDYDEEYFLSLVVDKDKKSQILRIKFR